jgi:hypothetical protein
MKQLTIAIAFLLAPAFTADAASALHPKRAAPATAPKARAADPAPVPSQPPVTRLPIPPDTFRA